ncbi:helix-turn-helix domain-containing protein [Kitasatospora sp. NPDC059795]|uniref:helix-turn-helix domain-containing protein n=1 Tax=Kitasatospora sp. NPDC059795 TaxID=3346949 RepID=UPI00365BEAE9
MRETPPPGGRTLQRLRRADDVLDLQAAGRRGGTAAVLRRLAARTRAGVLLLHPSGTDACPPPTPVTAAERALARAAVREALTRSAGSAAVGQDALICLVVTLPGRPGTRPPVLAAVAPRPAPPELPVLLADAASVLGLTWEAEHGRRQAHRARLADTGTREAVLHLLLDGQTAVARRLARTLRRELPDTVRMYALEGPADARREATDWAAATGASWTGRDPGTTRTLVLAPAADTRPLPPWLHHPAVADTCHVGISLPVPLDDTVTAHRQALHALTAARRHPERRATHAPPGDLAAALGPAGTQWAAATLAPLHAYRAARPQDPDGPALLATAAAWLQHPADAAAHLGIHRNTLAARLAHLHHHLGLDPRSLADRATLAIALSVIPDGSSSSRGCPGVDELMGRPPVVEWARRRLHPLHTPDTPPALARTLASWLGNDARIAPTARELGLSPAAVRKRLTRIETLLACALLRPPTAVHELWFAHRTLERAGRPS